MHINRFGNSTTTFCLATLMSEIVICLCVTFVAGFIQLIQASSTQSTPTAQPASVAHSSLGKVQLSAAATSQLKGRQA